MADYQPLITNRQPPKRIPLREVRKYTGDRVDVKGGNYKMGLLDFARSMLGLVPGDQTTEVGKMAEKMTAEQVNAYMKQQCGFVPRMFQLINRKGNNFRE